MKRTKRRSYWFPVILAILALGGGGFWYYRITRPPVYQLTAVTKSDISSIVTVTGRIKPADSVDLAFEKGGKIKDVFVKIGDKVTAGQSLAYLDTSELAANLLQAQANVEAQAAKLDELKQGTRPEEIQVKIAELKKAEQDLTNNYASVLDVLNDAYTKADDAVRTKADTIFWNGDSDSPQLVFAVTDTQVQIDVVNSRKASGVELRAWRKELSSVSATSSQADLDLLLQSGNQHMYVVRDYLSHALDAVNKSSGVAPADAATYKANIGLGRANVSTAVSAVSAQQQAIAAQRVIVERVRNELALLQAGSTAESIAAQDAQVKQAQANVVSIQAQIAKGTLYAPIAGIVTKQDAKAGEIAAPNAVLITIMGEQNLEIEANVPEVDVGRIAIGKSVAITLDAFPGEKFSGTVSYIDPAETVIDGVVNFKVTIRFSEANAKFRSGLTANLEIESVKKAGVLVLPESAVIENDKGAFVRTVQLDGTTIDTQVTLGIRNNGFVEVVSGVYENQDVVNVGLRANATK